jgi:hypothetical protein
VNWQVGTMDAAAHLMMVMANAASALPATPVRQEVTQDRR